MYYTTMLENNKKYNINISGFLFLELNYKLLINLCLEIKIIIYFKNSDINILLTRTYEPFCD